MVLVVATSEKDPKIYKEAIESINANLWKEVINSELVLLWPMELGL